MATYVQQVLLLLDSLATLPVSTRVLIGRVAGPFSIGVNKEQPIAVDGADIDADLIREA
jgi:hypothetical protein